MNLTNRQIFSLMTAFLLGNVLSGIGGTTQSEKTGYLSVGFGLILFLLLIGVYQTIFCRHRGKNLFDVLSLNFGKAGEKVMLSVTALYAFLSFFLCTEHFLKFVTVSTYGKTPQIPALILIVLLMLYFSFSGEKVMGRYAEIAFPVILFAVGGLLLLGVRAFDTENLVFPTRISSFLKQGSGIFLSPLSEVIFVFFLIPNPRENKKLTAISMGSGIVVTLVFSAVYLFNLLILGQEFMGTLEFPTFYAASAVKVGTLIERAETLITVSYSFCDLLYGGVCLLVLNHAISRLFSKSSNKTSIKKTAAPCAAALVILLILLWNPATNLQKWYWVIPFLFLPFTVGVPLILVFRTLYLQKKCKKNAKGTQ